MNTEENKQIMARNIKKYMERKGVSNQMLCDDLGFKYTTFMDWIKGVTYPRIGKVEAMAQYFGCEKSDLIEDKETQPTVSDGLGDCNVIRIAGRDGSYQVRKLTDDQIALIQAMLDQLPDVPDDL